MWLRVYWYRQGNIKGESESMFRMNDEPDPDHRHGNCGWTPTSRGDKIFRKKGARSHQAEKERGDRMEIVNQRRRHLTVVVVV